MSTSAPRSNTMGDNPAFAKVNAVNIPAGPNPTTIGLFFKEIFLRRGGWVGVEEKVFSLFSLTSSE